MGRHINEQSQQRADTTLGRHNDGQSRRWAVTTTGRHNNIDLDSQNNLLKQSQGCKRVIILFEIKAWFPSPGIGGAEPFVFQVIGRAIAQSFRNRFNHDQERAQSLFTVRWLWLRNLRWRQTGLSKARCAGLQVEKGVLVEMSRGSL